MFQKAERILIMCGIAGILYKQQRSDVAIGKNLIDMLDGCQHRGPDSTGFALYHRQKPDQLRLRFFVGTGDSALSSIEDIENQLAKFQAKVLDKEFIGRTLRVTVKFSGDIQKFAYAIEKTAKVISIGNSLDIIKDMGGAHDVDSEYGVEEFKGSHGIGHVRLATESDVKLEAAHPFWATGFADIAIVHNGQITNYWKMRRRLEQRNFKFNTDNDSELIAVYLADMLSKGQSLMAALETSIEDMDGTFSFLVSTKDEIGYAKDRLAAKPMVKFENEELIAIASEEVSLNRLFPGQALNTMEPPPGTFDTWQKST